LRVNHAFRPIATGHGIDPAMGALTMPMHPDQLFRLAAKKASHHILLIGCRDRVDLFLLVA